MFYLIKNNLKLMLRNKWCMILLIVGPFVVTAVLASAMSGLMSSFEAADTFSAGYRMESGSFAEDYIDAIIEAGNEAGITFVEYPQGEPENIIANNELAGFVEFTADEYIVHRVNNRQIEGVTLEYFLGRIMAEGTNTALETITNEPVQEISLPKTELEFMPEINSTDYYGIVFIVMYGCLSILCATGVLSSEKKYGIGRKYVVTGLSTFEIYIARLIPIVLAASVALGISAVCSALMYGIHWGNLLLSAVILIIMISAASAFGLMLYGIFDNLVATIIPLFSIVWTMCFFGGSYETYMYSSFPESLKNISPIYHVNRALVELSCMGKSDYVFSAIGFCLAIFAVSTLAAVAAENVKRRVKA